MNAMTSMIQNEVMTQRLTASLVAIKDAGIEVPFIEAGPETFNFVMALALVKTPLTEVEFTRRLIENSEVALRFLTVRLVRCYDVPEWSFWPPRAVSVAAVNRKLGRDGEHDDGRGY